MFPSSLWCLIILHSPGGQQLWLSSEHFVAMAPGEAHQGHVAKGINAIINMGNKSFGVTETPNEIERMIGLCREQKQ
jgi:hypothetical protein